MDEETCRSILKDFFNGNKPSLVLQHALMNDDSLLETDLVAETTDILHSVVLIIEFILSFTKSLSFLIIGY